MVKMLGESVLSLLLLRSKLTFGYESKVVKLKAFVETVDIELFCKPTVIDVALMANALD